MQISGRAALDRLRSVLFPDGRADILQRIGCRVTDGVSLGGDMVHISNRIDRVSKGSFQPIGSQEIQGRVLKLLR